MAVVSDVTKGVSRSDPALLSADANSAGRVRRASASSTALIMPHSSGPKNAAAMSTYSVTTTRAGHVGAAAQLVIGRAQDRPHQRLDAAQRPAFGERLVEPAVDRRLFAQHARDDVAEEGELRRIVGVALDLLPDPVRLEFRQDVVQPLLGDLHLVERLGGGEARGGAQVGLLSFIGPPPGV